jgi:hypothetical protein
MRIYERLSRSVSVAAMVVVGVEVKKPKAV